MANKRQVEKQQKKQQTQHKPGGVLIKLDPGHPDPREVAKSERIRRLEIDLDTEKKVSKQYKSYSKDLEKAFRRVSKRSSVWFGTTIGLLATILILFVYMYR
jgi:hypothetical protein